MCHLVQRLIVAASKTRFGEREGFPKVSGATFFLLGAAQGGTWCQVCFWFVLLFFQVPELGAQIVDLKLFFFLNLCLQCYTFPSHNCFSCVSQILVCCIFTTYEIYFLISLDTSSWIHRLLKQCGFFFFLFFQFSGVQRLSYYLSTHFQGFFLFVCFCFRFCVFAFSRALSVAYGGSQSRSLIRAVAAGLCQSQSNARSELCL